jgi:invasion protein IalB
MRDRGLITTMNSYAGRWLTGVLLSVGMCASALAAPAVQRAAQPQPAQSDTPQMTTATYGDWVVQCETVPKPPNQKVCDMAQTTQVQGRDVPFSRVAVAHPARGQAVKLIVQVPVNVSFSANVRVRTADTDPGIVAPFARCIPNGCFAEFDLRDDMLKKLYAASGVGKLSFTGAAGREIDVPLSFKGFAQAYDALSRE